MQNTNRFEYAAKIALYVLAALLPIFFIPMPVGIEFGREVVFGVLILLAAILWLVGALTKKEFRFQHSPILYALGFLLLVFGASAFFSKVPYYSMFLALPFAARVFSLILAAVLAFLAGTVFRKKEEAADLILILIFSGALAALIGAVQLIFNFSVYKYIASFANAADFNAVGTANGASLFYVSLLAITSGILFSSLSQNFRKILRWALVLAAAIFLLNIALVNFRMAWVVLLGSSILLLGLLFRGRSEEERGQERGDWKYWTSLALLALSVLMIMVKTPLWKTNVAAEVSPSLSATLKIAQSVFREGTKSVLLGSGPGTFGYDWNLYKDVSINQTIFWGVRFNQGFSWLAILLPTVGILGVLAFLVFLGASVFVFLKKLLGGGEENVLGTSVFLGLAALVLAAFMYQANSSLLLLLFLECGLLSFLFSQKEFLEEGAASERSFWDLKEKIVKFEGSGANFVFSLAAVLLLALAVAGVYFEVSRARAALADSSGVSAYTAGNTNEAINDFGEAAALDENNPDHYNFLAQAQIGKLNGLIQRAASGENVSQEFQTLATQAVQNAKQTTTLNPYEPDLWHLQGSLYELLIPFIQGAEQAAFDSYQKAIALDPNNPSIYVDLSRAGLTFADKIQLAAGQPNAQNKDQLQKLWQQVLQGVVATLNKAVELKPDFASAHFLLAQAYLRAGDLQTAIKSTQNAELAAPNDIGIVFQLGVLYYQTSDFDKAQAEFERAVALNPNYSNALYFLGLIYDKKDKKGMAIAAFQKIAALNPDNQEIAKILANLRAGKPALEGIVPPAQAPEKRVEVPVGEKESNSALRSKKR